MTDELKKQFTLKISTANKTELIVILYEILLIYVEEAIQADKAKDKDGRHQSIRKAKACLHELILSLNFTYPIAGNLLQLYHFAERELMRVETREESEGLLHVRSMIEKLHSAYDSIRDQDQSAPVMGNAQTVYAGLTYGRNSLLENLADQGSNRGFRA